MDFDIKDLLKIHAHKAAEYMSNFVNDHFSRNTVMIQDITKPEISDRKLVETYQYLAMIIADQIKQVEKETGFYHTCTNKCVHCCYQAIFITSDETKIITHWIKHHLDSRSVNDLKRKLKSWIALFYKSGFTKGYDGSIEFKQRYFNAHLACPFLNNKSCSIYPVRPTVCRFYFSYDEPRLCSQSAIVENTLDGEPWRQALLPQLVLLRESVTMDVSLFETYQDTQLTLLPIAVKQTLN